MMDKLRSVLKRLWISWGRDLAVVLIIMVPFRSSIADWNHVPSGSMKPSIIEGDRIFVNKLAYDLKIPLSRIRLATWGHPERGDIVTFKSPEGGTRLVKRVVGLPGDIVEMKDNRLVVNHEPAVYTPLADDISNNLEPVEASESQLAFEGIEGEEHPVMVQGHDSPLRSFGPVQVPEGQYLMLGDNRDNSADSRVFGFVERSLIIGKVPAVVMSFDPERFYLPRLTRGFEKLP